ncbi:hypothetical protein J2Z37_002096 [Ammoniphilus resinae]|uniref:Uncharacterized protein n=1 Tax=Ammoniphilus resinae TaxID=861532 RepID=A0ABS4GQE8_9BACL|nr:hypothetical protein [Ammoniphilus resinae]
MVKFFIAFINSLDEAFRLKAEQSKRHRLNTYE